MKPVFVQGAEWFDADHATKWTRLDYDDIGIPFRRNTLWHTRHAHYVLETEKPDRHDNWERTDIETLDNESALVWLMLRDLELPDDLAELQRTMEI